MFHTPNLLASSAICSKSDSTRFGQVWRAVRKLLQLVRICHARSKTQLELCANKNAELLPCPTGPLHAQFRPLLNSIFLFEPPA